MRNFLFGFIAGAATYHYVMGGSNTELVTEMRGWIKSVDDRLAEAEKQKDVSTPDEPTTPFTPPSEPQA